MDVLKPIRVTNASLVSSRWSWWLFRFIPSKWFKNGENTMALVWKTRWIIKLGSWFGNRPFDYTISIFEKEYFDIFRDHSSSRCNWQINQGETVNNMIKHSTRLFPLVVKQLTTSALAITLIHALWTTFLLVFDNPELSRLLSFLMFQITYWLFSIDKLVLWTTDPDRCVSVRED